MSYYNEQDDDLEQRTEREVTLSTLTILGIFFALALICAACFGLGYNMGNKAHQSSTTDTAATPSTTNFNTFKPSPGSPAIQPVPGYLTSKDAAAANSNAANTAYNPPAAASSNSIVKEPPPSRAAPASDRDEVRSAPIAAAEPARVAAPVPAPIAAQSGSVIVQVAAVSHQEDADLLVSALKQKGYPVVSRTEPGDRFFHIQIGPFPSKAAAEPTRQRLITDGYNALVK